MLNFLLSWTFPDPGVFNFTVSVKHPDLHSFLPEREYFLAPVFVNDTLKIAPFKVLERFYIYSSNVSLNMTFKFEKVVFFSDDEKALRDENVLLSVTPRGYVFSGKPSEGDIIVCVAGIPQEGESFWNATEERLFLSSFSWVDGGAYVLRNPWRKLMNYASRFRGKLSIYNLDDFVDLNQVSLSDFSFRVGDAEGFVLDSEFALWSLPLGFVEDGKVFIVKGLPAILKVYDMSFLRFPVFSANDVYAILTTALEYGFSFYRGSLSSYLSTYIRALSRSKRVDCATIKELPKMLSRGKKNALPELVTEPFSSPPEGVEFRDVEYPVIGSSELLKRFRKLLAGNFTGGTQRGVSRVRKSYFLVDPFPWDFPVLAVLRGVRAGMTVYEGDRWLPVYISSSGAAYGTFITPVPFGFEEVKVTGYRGGFSGGVNVATDGALVSKTYRLIFGDGLKEIIYEPAGNLVSIISAPVEVYKETSSGISKMEIRGNYREVGSVFGRWSDDKGAISVTLFDSLDAMLFESSLELLPDSRVSVRFPFNRELFKGAYVKIISSFGESFFQKSQPAVGLCPGILVIRTSAFNLLFVSSRVFLFNFAKDGLTLTFDRPFRFFMAVLPVNDHNTISRGYSLLAHLFQLPEVMKVAPEAYVCRELAGKSLFKVEPSFVVVSQQIKDSSVFLKLYNPSDASEEVKFCSDFFEIAGARAAGVILPPRSYSEVSLRLLPPSFNESGHSGKGEKRINEPGKNTRF